MLDKQESQTGFLLRNDSSSEYNNFTSVRLLFPMNDDSLTVQRLCSEMPRSEPPSQILTHILTFPPLAAFALYTAGSSALARRRWWKTRRWPFEPSCLHRKAAAKRSAANLIALQQNQPTVLWFCGSAERPSRFNARSRGL